MSILSRYVLRAHVAPAAAGLAIFYFVLSMDFLVDYLNLFIAKGVPGIAVLEAFLLSLAWMTLLAVPMAVMVAVLTAFGRLSQDNEITAAKANGVGVLTLIAPVLIVAAAVSFGLFQFGDRLLPAANHRLTALLVDIHKIKPLASVEPGILTELPGGYRILVDRLDPKTSEIFDVRIYKIESGDPLQTIVAQRGRVSDSAAEGIVRLELFDGEIQELDPEDPTRFNRLLFDKHVINMERGTADLVRTERTKRGERELPSGELKAEVVRQTAERKEARARIRATLEEELTRVLDAAYGQDVLEGPASVRGARESALRAVRGDMRTIAGSLDRTRRYEVEYHKKFSIPFSCVVFVLLGAPLGIRSRRGGVGIGAGIGILFFLVYYLFLVGGEQLGDRGMISPFWAMWAPNVLFGAAGLFLTLSTGLEWRITPVTRAIDFVLRPPRTDAAPEAAP
jgi:lipopolysaccharide export system permease protein